MIIMMTILWFFFSYIISVFQPKLVYFVIPEMKLKHSKKCGIHLLF